MSSFSIDVKQLLEAGAHFGHKTSRWHPKMAPYIHSKRGGTHIIDLIKTSEHLELALDFLQKTVAGGKQVLLVSTKPQAQALVKAVADETGMPYVTERWLGGLLTNQNTVGKRIKHLKELEDKMASGELSAKYAKLEVQRFSEEIEAMNHLYGGVKEMHAKPGALFIVDIVADQIAVKEARKLGIPVVALVDTNADPSQIDYPVPSNDDAVKTIKLMLDFVQQAILAGKAKAKAPTVEKPAETKKAATPEPKEEAKDEPEQKVKSEPKPKKAVAKKPAAKKVVKKEEKK